MSTILLTAHFMFSVNKIVWPDKIELKIYLIVFSDGNGNGKIEHNDKKRVSNSFRPPPVWFIAAKKPEIVIENFKYFYTDI